MIITQRLGSYSRSIQCNFVELQEVVRFKTMIKGVRGPRQFFCNYVRYHTLILRIWPTSRRTQNLTCINVSVSVSVTSRVLLLLLLFWFVLLE